MERGGQDLIKKLLTTDRTKRLGCLRGGAEDIKQHKWFRSINWQACYDKQLQPPFIPPTKAPDDTSMFDEYPESTEGNSKFCITPSSAKMDLVAF